LLELPAVVARDGKFYVATCPVNNVTSQGATVEEALSNLEEALELYYEDENAEIPAKVESPLLTTVKVERHEKTTASVRA